MSRNASTDLEATGSALSANQALNIGSRLFQRHLGQLILISLLTYGALAGLGLLIAYESLPLVHAVENGTILVTEDALPRLRLVLSGTWLLLLVGMYLSMATLHHAVADAYLDGTCSWRESFRRTVPRLPAILGVTLLVALLHVALGLLTGSIIEATSGAPRTVVIVLAVLAHTAVVVLGLFVMPVAVREQLNPLEILARAWALLRGRWLVTTVVLILLVVVVAVVLFALTAGLAGALRAGATTPLRVLAGVYFGFAVPAALLTPLIVSVLTVAYFDLRVRQGEEIAGVAPIDAGPPPLPTAAAPGAATALAHELLTNGGLPAVSAALPTPVEDAAETPALDGVTDPDHEFDALFAQYFPVMDEAMDPTPAPVADRPETADGPAFPTEPRPAATDDGTPRIEVATPDIPLPAIEDDAVYGLDDFTAEPPAQSVADPASPDEAEFSFDVDQSPAVHHIDAAPLAFDDTLAMIEVGSPVGDQASAEIAHEVDITDLPATRENTDELPAFSFDDDPPHVDASPAYDESRMPSHGVESAHDAAGLPAFAADLDVPQGGQVVDLDPPAGDAKPGGLDQLDEWPAMAEHQTFDVDTPPDAAVAGDLDELDEWPAMPEHRTLDLDTPADAAVAGDLDELEAWPAMPERGPVEAAGLLAELPHLPDDVVLPASPVGDDRAPGLDPDYLALTDSDEVYTFNAAGQHDEIDAEFGFDPEFAPLPDTGESYTFSTAALTDDSALDPEFAPLPDTGDAYAFSAPAIQPEANLDPSFAPLPDTGDGYSFRAPAIQPEANLDPSFAPLPDTGERYTVGGGTVGAMFDTSPDVTIRPRFADPLPDHELGGEIAPAADEPSIAVPFGTGDAFPALDADDETIVLKPRWSEPLQP